MTAPLTPAGCDLSDFPRMMLDIRRLRSSSFDSTLDDSAWRAGLNLWMSAWHQTPAASLEDVEPELAKAAGLGRDVKTWRKVKAVALRGWVSCADGRLYHETLAEIALEAWIDKLGQRLSSGAGNAKRYGLEFDPAPVVEDIRDAAEHLRALNPRSRTLTKQLVLKAAKSGPPDLPPGDVKLPPGVPSGSQENGMERRIGEPPKKGSPISGRDAPEARPEGASGLRSEPEDTERGWLFDAKRAEEEELRCRRSDPDRASELAEFAAHARNRAAELRRARLIVVEDAA